MAIIFRCPECDHKLRASRSAAGRRSKCKCGAVVTIPSSAACALGSPRGRTEEESAEETSPAWGLDTTFSSAGDLCEVITAWSPLCAQTSGQPASGPRQPGGYWRGVIAGSAAVLTTAAVVVGLVFAFRSGQAPEQPVAQKTGEDGDKVAGKSPPPSNPPIVDKQKSTTEKKPGKKETKPPVKVKPVVTVKPKPVSKDAEKIEIVEWHTTAMLTVIGDSGNQEIELSDKATQMRLVVVTAKLSAALLARKDFDLSAPDIKLKTPSIVDPKLTNAIGCGVGKQWFAPSQGRRAYIVPKSGPVVQSWLFIAPMKDLDLGLGTFQFRDRPALTLTVSSRHQTAP